MSSVHSYIVRGDWTGDRLSVGNIRGDSLSTAISIPKNLGGPGEGTNPEELLLSAAHSCYLITLSTLLTNRKIPFTKLELESEASVISDKGLRFDRVEHRPTIYVAASVDEQHVAMLAEHAEHACMVSSAMRGNVEFVVTPKVLAQSAK